MSAGKVLNALYGAIDLNDLDDKTLGELDDAEHINLQLSNTAEIMQGLATLICQDPDRGPDGIRSGALQEPAEIATMLWMFSTNISDLVAAAEIAHEAAFVISKRRENTAIVALSDVVVREIDRASIKFL
ncbi:hypothetical protein [Sulfuritalea hydrogenivorans]|uniref:Uncharacterized protein n=1 Tax=Sulfuritalea hydrogenivorans sk43H TaxID=1223802 RepID=W0SEL9_9PROT|nr:hypothetical protein [Sulfuritalea hydrogenivorans]BAO29372.1 hypothetical protein SUTH_01579 [Sulfuritalea hydrogenivorans sk43H]